MGLMSSSNHWILRMKIIAGGFDDSQVQQLLTYHFTSARAETACGSAHALDLAG